MSEKTKVGIIGYKDSAATLLKLLCNCEASVWTPSSLSSLPTEIPEHIDIKAESVGLEQLEELHLLILTLPAIHVRPALKELAPILTGRHFILYTARNVEPITSKSVACVIDEETPVRRVGFLTGPLSEADVANGRVTAACCATEFNEVADFVAEIIGPRLAQLERIDDLHGAEAAARFARIVSFAYAIAAQLDFGRSAQSMISCTGLHEAARYVTYCKGYEPTTYSLAGLGNFHLDITGNTSVDVEIATCCASKGNSSGQIRDYIESTFKEKGRDFIQLVETLHEEMKYSKINMSILDSCYEMICGTKDARTAFSRYVR